MKKNTQERELEGTLLGQRRGSPRKTFTIHAIIMVSIHTQNLKRHIFRHLCSEGVWGVCGGNQKAYWLKYLVMFLRLK